MSRPLSSGERPWSRSICSRIAIAFLATSYQQKSPAATFRLIVNPMVTWIWIGGIIGLGGALVALWPSALADRRRITSLYAARLGRELSRARA